MLAALYLQEGSWYSFLLEAGPKAIVPLKGLGKLIKSTSSGLDPATFWLVKLYLNQLRYHSIRYYLLSGGKLVKFQPVLVDHFDHILLKNSGTFTLTVVTNFKAKYNTIDLSRNLSNTQNVPSQHLI
jgi:hypothetical protein